MIRILGIALMAAGSPTALLAYADPGTGMLIWQSAIAVSIGFLFTTRRFVARVLKRNR